jgi:hypothetical protein
LQLPEARLKGPCGIFPAPALHSYKDSPSGRKAYAKTLLDLHTGVCHREYAFKEAHRQAKSPEKFALPVRHGQGNEAP